MVQVPLFIFRDDPETAFIQNSSSKHQLEHVYIAEILRFLGIPDSSQAKDPIGPKGRNL